MKLTAFQSDKGDCLLLETADGHHRMLIDGGTRSAYSEHVAPALAKLRKNDKQLDIVYVSHIDDDHIAGVLQLLDDEAAARVHQHHLDAGNTKHKVPPPRPASIGSIFHNSFHDQIGTNSGAIESMLAATARILSGSERPSVMQIAEHRREIAASVPQALRVSNRIGGKQLKIPLNLPYGGQLMMVEDGMPTIQLGSISLKVIGPFAEDVRKLRTCWNNWLRTNQKTLKEIRTQARSDESELNAVHVDLALGPLLSAAEQLGASEVALAKTLGNRAEVTVPNLASLMFLATEKGNNGSDVTFLLTGDGHADDILKGLDRHNALDSAGKIHVSVLKVQHHGSEHNIDKSFCDAVTADHYVFCGNGKHQNPDLDVVKLIHDRRMASDSKPFSFWFNSSSAYSTQDAANAHMHAIEALVEVQAVKSNRRQSNHFIKGSSMMIG